MGVKGTVRTLRWNHYIVQQNPDTMLSPNSRLAPNIRINIGDRTLIDVTMWNLDQAMFGSDGRVNLLDMAKEVDEVAGTE